ncbi:MAG: 3-deoxy-7-phosphoheptulonate synthase [Bacteroidetes bacterium]|nr:3-deoxy-7-phosphoheptulonate synthase [Bacteroidota bacterium]
MSTPAATAKKWTGLPRPWIISGPCSAETESQVLSTAKALADSGNVHLFRAGIWKPRTKPGGFEGVGVEGLQWLKTARQEYGLPFTVEVATAKQVEDALQYEADVLWIGARTTVNPFSVQALADALKGVKIPVLIKNPLNPDLELWAGALERIAGAGIEKIGLIHRGFSNYGNSEYRNVPMWHLAIEMKLRHPQLPMINDPSHICGRRDLLMDVMQRAIDLDFDGLMIESHPNPDQAWSDANQQVTPVRLMEMLAAMRWRTEDINSDSFHTALEALRQQINQLDNEMVQLLGRRMQVAEEIGRYKKENNITILQAGRWQEIIERACAQGERVGLSREFITRYLEAVHMESINRQKKVLDN